MPALIRISAADIPTEGFAVDVPLPSRWLDAALGDQGRCLEEAKGRVAGRLSRSGHDIVVRGSVQATVAVPCVRCLEPANVEVRADLSLLLQPASRAGQARRTGRRQADSTAQEYVFTAAEAEIDVYDGESVVLDDFVREAILLEIPSFPLCCETCPGLSAQAIDQTIPRAAIDPRLEPLRTFSDNDGPASVEDLVAAAAERSRAMGRKPRLRANRSRPRAKKTGGGKTGKR